MTVLLVKHRLPVQAARMNACASLACLHLVGFACVTYRASVACVTEVFWLNEHACAILLHASLPCWTKHGCRRGPCSNKILDPEVPHALRLQGILVGAGCVLCEDAHVL